MGKKLYPPLDTIHFEFTDSYSCEDFRAKIWDAPNTIQSGYAIGVDPGRNFGVTIIDPEKIRMIHGVIKKGDYLTYGFGALVVIQWALKFFQHWHVPAIIEGAAYKKEYGQTGLAYIRMGFAVSLHLHKQAVRIVPPASIRKVVFGKGDENGMFYFPTFNGNGVASLGMAMYGLGYRCPKTDGPCSTE